MEKYDSYRDSGIEWLGEIPTHWEMVRNKSFMRPTDEKVGDRKDEFVLLSLTKQGVIVRDLSEGKGKFPKDYDTYLVVRPSNLVFCLFDVDETPRTVGLVKNVGMLTGAYTNFEFFNDLVLPEFAYYYYLKVDDVKGLRPYYTGLRKVVKSNTFLQLRMPVPPLPEQKAIVEYLDRETRMIDAFIAAKEKELALLDELKQAEIANAVTHGLNPDAPMMPSGISWLGDIPAHWDVKKLKVFCKENKVKNVGNTEKTVLSLSYGNIIVKENLTFGLVPESYESYQIVQPGDIILRLTDLQNDHKSLRTGLVRNQGIITNAYVGLKISHQLPEYVQLLLHTYDLLKVFYSMGGGLRQSMTYQDVANLYICFPSIEEQKAIVEYAEKKTESISSLKFAIACEIDHLKEYKQRLIADAVTGQIKVC